MRRALQRALPRVEYIDDVISDTLTEIFSNKALLEKAERMIARFEDFGHPAYSEARTQRQLFGLVYPVCAQNSTGGTSITMIGSLRMRATAR